MRTAVGFAPPPHAPCMRSQARCLANADADQVGGRAALICTGACKAPCGENPRRGVALALGGAAPGSDATPDLDFRSRAPLAVAAFVQHVLQMPTCEMGALAPHRTYAVSQKR